MKGRILVYPPGHPYLVAVYITVAVIISLFASSALASIISELGGLESLPLSYLVSYLILLSPPLSFVNIALARLRTGYAEQVLEMDYVVIFGIPVPIPRVRLVERKSILAINVGGGLIPITASLILAYVLWHGGGVYALYVTIAAVAVTALVTYLTSRTIPGVGIAVPALFPPLTSSLVSITLAGSGPLAAIAAYIGGSLGALIGADVLRLARDLDKLVAPVISIGGAGVFDGIFLSGVIAALLAY